MRRLGQPHSLPRHADRRRPSQDLRRTWRSGSMQDLDSFIDQVKNLPAVPAVLPKLLALLRKTEVDNDQVITLITFEPALTAHVLRACNSAMFGSSRPADDVQEAVMRLGFRELYGI